MREEERVKEGDVLQKGGNGEGIRFDAGIFNKDLSLICGGNGWKGQDEVEVGWGSIEGEMLGGEVGNDELW
jgi:hypothetical protein